MEIEHNVELIRGTNEEWTGKEAGRIIERGVLAHNTTTGETRVGPGVWNTCVPSGIAVDIEVVAIVVIPIVIATGLNSGDTINGGPVQVGKPYLLTAQTDPAENGIWVAGPSPARHASYSAYDQLPGVIVKSLALGQYYKCTSTAGGTIGTTALTFTRVAAGVMRFSDFGPDVSIPQAAPALGDKVFFYDVSDGGSLKWCTLTQAQTLINT